MVDVRNKLKNLNANTDSKTRRVVIASVMIFIALVMFFGAMFMPIQYYSNKEVLHVVQTDDGEGDVKKITQTERVHQSLFRVFGAVGELGNASKLHKASHSTINDNGGYERARARLTDLRNQYQSIYAKTERQANEKGISLDSSKFRRMLADNLSGMNFMALDLLEIAFESDNTGIYEAQYAGVILALLGSLINVFIMITAVLAIIFAAVMFVSEQYKNPPHLFLNLFMAFSLVELTLYAFNPIAPPAAGPLALACISTIVYFIAGLWRALVSDSPTQTVVKQVITVGSTVIIVLMLAQMPSLTVYAKGLGGKYLYYPGTIGTGSYSRIDIITKVGISISYGPVVTAFLIGGLAAIIAVACAATSLNSWYKGRLPYNIEVALLFEMALSVAFIAIMAAISRENLKGSEPVAYIPGVCWYVIMAMCIAVVAYSMIDEHIASKKKRSAEVVISEEKKNDEFDTGECASENQKIDGASCEQVCSELNEREELGAKNLTDGERS